MNKTFYITDHRVESVGPVTVQSITPDRMHDKPPTDSNIYLIDGSDFQFLENSCKEIRQNPCPAVYLRPIAAVTGSQKLPGHLERICDVQIPKANLTDFTFQHAKDIAAPINQAIEALPDFMD